MNDTIKTIDQHIASEEKANKQKKSEELMLLDLRFHKESPK